MYTFTCGCVLALSVPLYQQHISMTIYVHMCSACEISLLDYPPYCHISYYIGGRTRGHRRSKVSINKLVVVLCTVWV